MEKLDHEKAVKRERRRLKKEIKTLDLKFTKKLLYDKQKLAKQIEKME